MFGSTIVDVAVGLIFLYFLLSVITSHVNELIAQIFRWRSGDLKNAVRNMLADPDLMNKVWNHPLIRGLAVKVGREPSYIPANTFALALFDAVAPSAGQPTALESVRSEVMKLPPNSARDAILGIITKSNGNLDQARQEVENWFNDSMERVTGAYRQRMVWVTALVSISVTFLFGVDSIALANSLWMEPGLRAALTGAATSFQSPDIQSTSLQDAVKTLNQNVIPIGWNSFPLDWMTWVRKLMGLLLTTLAVSLGAPFWFDVLKKVANIRYSGPPPAK